MKLSSRRVFACVLAFTFIMVVALRPSFACGPFSRYAIFSYSKHPDLPLDRYLGGDIGVLRSNYARSYLFVAYRLMNGGSFGTTEKAALSQLWNERLDFTNANSEEDTTLEWIAVRAKVPGIGPEQRLDVNRAKGKDEYDSFVNCSSDAFKNAARTLSERIAKAEPNSPEVKAWTVAQDQVFSNCGGGQTIPEQTTSSDPKARADRAYQIAAAYFYSMNFDEARTRFEVIAADKSSEWHEKAQYLVARCLIRKASLGDPAGRSDALGQAEIVLKKVLGESRNGVLLKSAQGLLHLVELRQHPDVRLRNLAQSLIRKGSNENLKQDLLDYTLLLDRYLGDSDQPHDEILEKAVNATGKDDLTDWIIEFQSADKDSLSRSIGNWEKTHSQPWLIACLSKLDMKDPKASSIMAEAERVEAGSPAFVTAQYHLIRLMIEKGDTTDAARRLDTLLQNENKLPPSAVNQFRHQRMTLASDMNDFLKFALRQPAAFSWDDDGRESPIDVKSDDELKPWIGRSLFDVDSTNLLNERFPLSSLREAASSRVLPDHVRRQIALVVWTRAVILDDVETGKAIAPIAAGLAPELKSYLDAYLNAKTNESRQSAGLYTLLKFPGLRPYLNYSTGRLTPIGERDIYRDNWWCEVTQTSGNRDGVSDGSEESAQEEQKPAQPVVPIKLGFLNNAQGATAMREYAQLLSLGTAPNYLSREAIEWANRAPRDPRVPEALHLAVTSTRYGCTDKESTKWSKAAFDVLHKRYPQSIWAKKTPYWFKDV